MKKTMAGVRREEFLSVYQGLYNEEESQQELAIRRIAVWKSRAGSKLSVAIESSGMLTQASLDHARTEREGALLSREALLRSSYSLALIRFVNHVIEKGQTKAIAQPVHLVAREFGIPEWIVRLRHEATHSSLPSLGALVTGSRWALHYLKEHFWKHQTLESLADDKDDQVFPRRVKMDVIRRTLYDFQKDRYQELNADDKEKEEGNVNKRISHTHVKILQKYLTQNRLRFIKCVLEDGALISTEDQLAAFGVSADDLMSQLPPTIPVEIAEFWRPLLKELNSSGALPLLAQTAVFTVVSGEGIRNYQLVAWVAYFLSLQSDLMSQLPPTIPVEIAEFWRPLLKELNSSGALPLLAQTAVFTVVSGEGIRNYQLVAWVAYFLSLQSDPSIKTRKKRRRKQEAMFKITTPLPKKTMLSACLQNVNLLTAYLLKYLADKESLGEENYNKLMKLLDVHSRAADTQVSSDECDSDTVYTVEDPSIKTRKKRKRKQEAMFKITTPLPKKTMLSACLQNVNLLTAYLLKYLADKESLGEENYNKLMKLLDVHSRAADTQVSSDECDSDTVYTVEDIKQACEKRNTSQEITPSTIDSIQNNICGNNVCWRMCTDIVDWASVPLGTLPNLSDDDDDSGDDGEDIQDVNVDTAKCDDNDDDYMMSRRKTSRKRHTSGDDDDDEDSDVSGSGTSPKRSQLTVTDSRLL